MPPRTRRTVLAPALQDSGPPTSRRGFLARLGAVFTGGALAGSGLLALPRRSQAATAGYEPFVGELALFGFNFAPMGWAQCNGQLLAIAQNTALFSLIGTYYGGNGTTTFGLPDLRGRFPTHMGQGAGLGNRTLGERSGAEYVTLLPTEMPSHSHAVMALAGNGTSDVPTGMYPARDPSGSPAYGASANTTLASATIQAAGGGQPHDNMPPYLVLNWCIALQGIFPPRS